jgi:hypothetical protein
MRKVVKHHDIYLIDDRVICEMLADLELYEYVPRLAPLKPVVLRLSAKVAKLKATTRGAINDKVRGDYDNLVRRFHQLLKPSEYDALRDFLRDRKYVEAKSIVFADSPY